MRNVVFLSFTFLFGFLALSMNKESIPNKTQVIRLNLGGYKFDTTLQTINQSGSDFLKALFSYKFTEEGRIFVDCSQEFARIMHNYMCHNILTSDCDSKLALAAADFFCCDGLKKLVKENESISCKWQKCKLESDDYLLMTQEGKFVFLCPLSHKEIIADKVHYNKLANLMAHLVMAHGVEFHSISNPGERGGYVTIKYKYDECQKTQIQDVANIHFIKDRNMHKYQFKYVCDICRIPIIENIFGDHITKFHQVEILYKDSHNFLYRCPMDRKPK